MGIDFSVTVPIIAAFIAAVGAILGLVITKENKVSEFRQEWINDLRSDVATLIASLFMIRHLVLTNGTEVEGREDWQNHFVKADTALAMIRLRLNENEAESQALLKVLDDFASAGVKDRYTKNEIEVIETNLLSTTRSILKTEWDRVRAGEKTYRRAKIAAWILSGIVLLALVGLVAGVIAGSINGTPAAKAPNSVIEYTVSPPNLPSSQQPLHPRSLSSR